jgi:hypothetical protein
VFKEHVSKLTDSQLKNRNRICLGTAILFLIGMIVLLLLAFIQISDHNESATLTALTPAILMPLIFIPLLYSSSLSNEIKSRKAE